jgi:hypothetical protein
MTLVVLSTKSALGQLGHYDLKRDGLDAIATRPMIDGVKSFQRDQGLKVDGLMKPEGPTAKRMTTLIGDPPLGGGFTAPDRDSDEQGGIRHIFKDKGYGPNEEPSRLMDLYNNRAGRELALDPKNNGRPSKDVIFKALTNGKLRTKPFKTLTPFFPKIGWLIKSGFRKQKPQLGDFKLDDQRTDNTHVVDRHRGRWLTVFCRLFWISLGAFSMLIAAFYVLEHSERVQACMMIASPLNPGPDPNIDYRIKITMDNPPGYDPQDPVYVLWDANRSAIGRYEYLKCPEGSFGRWSIFTITWDDPKSGKQRSLEVGDPSLKPDMFYVVFTNDNVFHFSEWIAGFRPYLSFVKDIIF